MIWSRSACESVPSSGIAAGRAHDSRRAADPARRPAAARPRSLHARGAGRDGVGGGGARRAGQYACGCSAVEVRWSEARVALAPPRRLCRTGRRHRPAAVQHRAGRPARRAARRSRGRGDAGAPGRRRDRPRAGLASAGAGGRTIRRCRGGRWPTTRRSSLDRDAALAAIARRPSAARRGAGRNRPRRRRRAGCGADRVPDLVISGGPALSSEPGRARRMPIGWEPVARGRPRRAAVEPQSGRHGGGRRGGQGGAARRRRARAGDPHPLRRRLAALHRRVAARCARMARVIVPKAITAYEMSLARYREMALAYPLVLTAQRALLERERRRDRRRRRRRPGRRCCCRASCWGEGDDVKLLRLVWHGLAVVGVLALAGGVWFAEPGHQRQADSRRRRDEVSRAARHYLVPASARARTSPAPGTPETLPGWTGALGRPLRQLSRQRRRRADGDGPGPVSEAARHALSRPRSR